MTLLLGALTLGLILSLLAMGVYVSFRIFSIPDITTDGSITLGAAVAAVLLVGGTSPIFATAAGALAGAVERRAQKDADIGWHAPHHHHHARGRPILYG